MKRITPINREAPVMCFEGPLHGAFYYTPNNYFTVAIPGTGYGDGFEVEHFKYKRATFREDNIYYSFWVDDRIDYGDREGMREIGRRAIRCKCEKDN